MNYFKWHSREISSVFMKQFLFIQYVRYRSTTSLVGCMLGDFIIHMMPSMTHVILRLKLTQKKFHRNHSFFKIQHKKISLYCLSPVISHLFVFIIVLIFPKVSTERNGMKRMLFGHWYCNSAQFILYF